MYYLERKEQVPGDQNGQEQNHSWKAIYTCPERWPLEDMLRGMDKATHRITSSCPDKR